MAAWKTCKLGEVADYVVERRSAKTLTVDNYISTENLLPDRGGRVVASALPQSGNVAAWQAEDVLVSNIRPYFKKIWMTQEGNGGASNDVLVVRARRAHVLPRFLYYRLASDAFFAYMMAGANGAKMPRGNREQIMRFAFPLPSLSEQERIAGVLGAYDDLIAVNVRRMALLEEAAHRLYRERFVTHADPAWPSRPLGEVAEVDPFIPVPKHKEEEPLFVSMGALDERSMCVDIFHAEWRKASGGSRFQNGDSLLARISPCLENGKAGFVMGLRPDEVAVGSTEFIVFRGKVWSGHMLYCLLRTPTFRGHAANSLRGADGRQRAQTPFLAAYRVPEPPPEAVAAFDAQVGPYFEAVGVLARENALLREARDGLLPRLLREEA